MLTIFRAVADSTSLLGLAFACTILSFAINQYLVSPLAAFEDGLNVPDVRVSGYTPDELHAWYDGIGMEGCQVYTRCATWDLYAIIPSYLIFLGAILVQQGRIATKPNEGIAFLPVAVASCDFVETYLQRHGSVVYPERLPTALVRIASAACVTKWVLLISTLMLIVGLWLGNKMLASSELGKSKKKE